MRITPSTNRATLSAPSTGRSAAERMPPPSLRSCHLRVQRRRERREIARRTRHCECAHERIVRLPRGGRPHAVHARAAAPSRPAAGTRRASARRLGDLGERHGEDIVEDEGHPLGGREGLEHHEQRGADGVVQGDPLEWYRASPRRAPILPGWAPGATPRRTARGAPGLSPACPGRRDPPPASATRRGCRSPRARPP